MVGSKAVRCRTKLSVQPRKENVKQQEFYDLILYDYERYLLFFFQEEIDETKKQNKHTQNINFFPTTSIRTKKKNSENH